MVADYIWSQTNYLAPIGFIFDAKIVEYDIRKANISVLYSKRAISKEQYETFLNMPKEQREISIGMMIRHDPSLQSALSDGIRNARKALCDILNLSNGSILAIKNDAIYVIYRGYVPKLNDIQINDYVAFVVKNVYDSFYFLNRIKLYYSYDPIESKESMDIDGLGDYGIEKCKPFLDILSEAFYRTKIGGCKSGLDYVNSIYIPFIHKEFPLECYRRLDPQARFDLVYWFEPSQMRYQADILVEESLNAIDPYFNRDILRQLGSYYLLNR